MEEINDEEYFEVIKTLLLKKNKVVRETNLFKRNKKLADYVIQKGYESYLVWKILKEINLEE
jgi:regulatory protein